MSDVGVIATSEQHDPWHRPVYGPETFWVCELCNYDRHRCHFCGDATPHAASREAEHECYVQARRGAR